jgi:hypothetical protein
MTGFGDYVRSEWFVQPNDLIGGYSIMPEDRPPSSGAPEIACFVSREHAEHIVELHNEWLHKGVSDEERPQEIDL